MRDLLYKILKTTIDEYNLYALPFKLNCCVQLLKIDIKLEKTSLLAPFTELFSPSSYKDHGTMLPFPNYVSHQRGEGGLEIADNH